MVCLHRLLLQVKTLTSTIVSGCEIISTPRFRQILEGLLEKLSGGGWELSSSRKIFSLSNSLYEFFLRL